MNIQVFNDYKNRAETALGNGDLESAKEFKISAGKTMLHMAKTTSGDAQRKMIDYAKLIIEDANSLSVSESNPPVKLKDSQPDIRSKKIESVSNTPDTSEGEDEFDFDSIGDTGVDFSHVAGNDKGKDVIRRRAIYPTNHPDAFKRFRKESGGAVVFVGLPGNGKTHIAKATAGETGAYFIAVNGSDLMHKYVGQTPKATRALFRKAKKLAGEGRIVIIFIDEMDGMLVKRESNSTFEKSMVAQFLTEMQGIEASENRLLVIGATNRPELIDSAFHRSGRFSERIYIPLPDQKAREQILRMKFEGVPLEEDIDFEALAESIKGFNCADCAEFVNRCSDSALERYIAAKEAGSNPDNVLVTKEEIAETLASFKSTVDIDDLKRLNDYSVKHSLNWDVYANHPLDPEE